MTYETFNKAMDEKKCVYGNERTREEIWNIYALSIAKACVEHKIWINYKEDYICLNNTMTTQEAYEITQVIQANWQVED